MNDATVTETKRFQCRHIFTDGHRCGSICLRGEPFCYYHHTTRKPAPRKTLGSHASFDLPLPEDRHAIQASIGIILQRIASNDLDPKRAGLLLYGLQIASLNLPKQQQNEDKDTLEVVHEITTDPELGTLAPQTEIKEKKSSVAILLEELRQQSRPKTTVLPQIQATEDPDQTASTSYPVPSTSYLAPSAAVRIVRVVSADPANRCHLRTHLRSRVRCSHVRTRNSRDRISQVRKIGEPCRHLAHSLGY